MSSAIDASIVGGRAPTTRLAIAALFFIHLLGADPAWPQELPPPKLDDEIAKQEKIYRSRGADRPTGYVINRGLADYADLLPAAFCNALGRLGRADRWLDIGAGTAQAILDYYTPSGDAAKNCGGAAERARAVALSIEDRRTDRWREQAAILGAERILYLSGRRLSQYSAEELGSFQMITDVFGGFSYTENLSRFVDKVLSLLEVGGSFYTLLPGVHLEHAKDKLGILYLTELEDAAGRRLRVCSWLKQTTCAQVTCESKSDWKRPTELITIRKTCSEVSVLRMTLVEFEAGYPPSRRFQVAP